MTRTCPHCTAKLPALSVLASGLGVRRYFVCRHCSRHLTVSRGWQAAFAAMLLLGFALCRLAARVEHSHLPYLALPLVLLLASLVVYHRGVVRIAGRRLGWISVFNVGLFGTAILALDYAISM